MCRAVASRTTWPAQRLAAARTGARPRRAPADAPTAGSRARLVCKVGDQLVEPVGLLEVQPVVAALEGDGAAARSDEGGHRLAASGREAAAVGAVQVEARQRDPPQQRPPVLGRVVGHQLAQVLGVALERLALQQRHHLGGGRLRQAALGVAVGERVHVAHRRLDVGEGGGIVDALGPELPVVEDPLRRRLVDEDELAQLALPVQLAVRPDDGAAERGADHDGPLEPEGLQQVVQVGGEPRHREAPRRLVARAVEAQVNEDDAAPRGQSVRVQCKVLLASAPPVHEHDRGAGLAALLVRQRDAVVGRDARHPTAARLAAR
mmetsp:Transcript_15352/g.49063  ORF Transcript_15352/g.49063 Transcript_15352/m.49063 type:complete len:320 (+) Transcript_15352:412-1371(+)